MEKEGTEIGMREALDSKVFPFVVGATARSCFDEIFGWGMCSLVRWEFE